MEGEEITGGLMLYNLQVLIKRQQNNNNNNKICCMSNKKHSREKNF